MASISSPSSGSGPSYLPSEYDSETSRFGDDESDEEFYTYQPPPCQGDGARYVGDLSTTDLDAEDSDASSSSDLDMTSSSAAEDSRHGEDEDDDAAGNSAANLPDLSMLRANSRHIAFAFTCQVKEDAAVLNDEAKELSEGENQIT